LPNGHRQPEPSRQGSPVTGVIKRTGQPTTIGWFGYHWEGWEFTEISNQNRADAIATDILKTIAHD
jgi:hypothetical protein